MTVNSIRDGAAFRMGLKATAELNSVWLVANSCSETVINGFSFASIPPLRFSIAKWHAERPELLCEMLPRLFLDQLGSCTVLISRDQKACESFEQRGHLT